MKYEIKTLRELKEGDYFHSMSDKGRKIKFQVVGAPVFNIRAGSATRRCVNLKSGFYEDKLCRVKVVHAIRETINDLI